MTTTTQTIEVERPLSTVYNQWTQFETFPEFMEGVEAVHQLDDRRLHWSARIGGVTRDWEAEIVDQIPDRLVSWQSIDGARNAGRVTFEPTGPDRTKVSLELDFEPDGFVEKTGDVLGMVERRVQGDLERFKTFIERRGAETGAWRGQIRGGQESPRY